MGVSVDLTSQVHCFIQGDTGAFRQEFQERCQALFNRFQPACLHSVSVCLQSLHSFPDFIFTLFFHVEDVLAKNLCHHSKQITVHLRVLCQFFYSIIRIRFHHTDCSILHPAVFAAVGVVWVIVTFFRGAVVPASSAVKLAEGFGDDEGHGQVLKDHSARLQVPSGNPIAPLVFIDTDQHVLQSHQRSVIREHSPLLRLLAPLLAAPALFTFPHHR
mmetsp:Transcript_22211/g.28748  ORF Transcript_22211/g.28748 Transcript_22211/m.28748 type:complete len:216 (-) Transcript_22211:120-767(-)